MITTIGKNDDDVDDDDDDDDDNNVDVSIMIIGKNDFSDFTRHGD